jgi:SAM-dependent methyltransferase
MATSPYDDTVLILDFLGRLYGQRPLAVLDVGAGFGRWGFLCRCHLGCGVSLSVEPRQKVRIDAIEGFAGNVSALYECVYDETHVGDACEVLPRLGAYDVVICSHMIEHLERRQGEELLAVMQEHARGAVVLSVPFGEWPQDAFGGNELEQHRSVWNESDFLGSGVFRKRFGNYGVVIYGISPEARWQVRMMRSWARRWAFRLYRRMRGRMWSSPASTEEGFCGRAR